VIVDKIRGTVTQRPGLTKVKELLCKGDTLVVWRLDRLGRSWHDLIAWGCYLEERDEGLQSLHESIDTSTPTGKLTFHLFGALAEFECNLIQDALRPARLPLEHEDTLEGAVKRWLLRRALWLLISTRKRRYQSGSSVELMDISKPTLCSYVQESKEAVSYA